MDCVSCGVNCTDCSFGVCSACANGTVYQKGICIASCTDGYYFDSATNQCLRCS